MRYDQISRRLFLQGMGKATLALPFLPSLLPREARAFSGSPVRYIQYITNTGVYEDSFFPSRNGLQDVAAGVKGMRLDSISGMMSPILNGPLDPFRKKLSILRGLDCLVDCHMHNQSIPTTAAAQSNQYAPGDNPYSVDAILSDSGKVYPNPAGKQKIVVFAPGGDNYGNYSFDTQNGKSYYLDLLTSTDALMAKFTWSGGSIPASDPLSGIKPKLMQDVYADYKTARDGRRISQSDRTRLEAYMSLINDIVTSLISAPAPSTFVCSQPALNAGSDIKNQINIIVAALACQLTNVVSFAQPVSSGGDDAMHFAAHHVDVTTHTAGLRDMVTPNIAYFLQKLDEIGEADGTLLDNSIFYYGNEFGSLEVSDQHVTHGMPVMVAGGAGGRLNPGYYLDYGGSAYNNLLVTFFNAMGLSSSDYERGGQTGFGSYVKNPNMSANDRRQPLPFFYKGSSLG
jgi:hypothetical protein